MDNSTQSDTVMGGQGVQDQGGQAQGAKKDDGKYNIPAKILEKYGPLIDKIKATESMSYEERQYWFQILPIMTDDQVKRLKKILDEESAQLAKLDEQYQGELEELNKKHLLEWNAFERKKEREARKSEEAAQEKEEAKDEEDILGELDNL